MPKRIENTTTATPGQRSGFGPGLGGWSSSSRRNSSAESTGISGPWLYSGSCQAKSSASMPLAKNTPAAMMATSSQNMPQVKTEATRKGAAMLELGTDIKTSLVPIASGPRQASGR